MVFVGVIALQANPLVCYFRSHGLMMTFLFVFFCRLGVAALFVSILTETQDTWRGRSDKFGNDICGVFGDAKEKVDIFFGYICMNLRCGGGKALSYFVHGESAETEVFSLAIQVEFKRLIHLLLLLLSAP